MFPARSQNVTAFLGIERQPTPEPLGKIVRGHTKKDDFPIPVQIGERDGNLIRTADVGMGVLGGIFSEGIDLAENRLIGACVVGTGLMAPDAEQRLLREYFDGQGKDGFRCAFQIPGMTRVMQAAGRVIRTPRDLGVILLLDRRFLRDSEKSLFPEEWSDAESVSLTDFPRKIREFWDGAGET